MLAFCLVPDDPQTVEPEAPLAGRYRFLRGISPRSWLAWDERSDCRVLVGLVSPEEEARFSELLFFRDQHIARVLDVQDGVPPAELPSGCEEGRAAIVTELSHGRSLSSLVGAEGPLTSSRAVAWTLRLARSLADLHQIGRCHQAISPSAIVDRVPGRPVAPVLTWLRAAPFGPALSPEALAGEEPSAADDVWSLCVTFYFALTGRYPFAGQSPEELLKAFQRPASALAEFGKDDAALQKIFDLAFAREASRRFRSMEEFASALDAYELEKPFVPGAQALVLGASLGRNLRAGLTKAAPLHKSLEGVVFDLSAVEPPALADIGPEPVPAGRISAELPRVSATALADRPSAPEPRRSISFPPINPFRKRKSRWPLAVVLLAAAGTGAAFALRSTAPAPKPEAIPTQPSQQAAKPAPPPRPKLSKAERLRACTESYFEDGTFEAEARFDFVCTEGPLHEVARELHELAEVKTDLRLAQQANGGKEEQPDDVVRGDVRASRVRRPLGWYELLATAIVRRSCCSPAPSVELPKTQGWCAQLGDVVEDLAEDSARSADLAPRVKRFDRAVDCLYANRTTIPYEDYASRPLDETQQSALQSFLSLAAMSEAKRRKLDF